MRMMCRFVRVGVAATCALAAWLACAQGAAEKPPEGDAKPAAEAKPPKKPMDFFGMNLKASDDNAEPRETKITSTTVDFDNKEGFILFDGDVLVDDAQFIMRSDKLMVFMEGTKDASQILAIGNVSIKNDVQKASATCDKAVYTKKENQMVMTADEGKIVHLVTNGDRANAVSGKRVLAWIDDEGFWHAKVLEGATVVLPGGLGGLKAKDDKAKDEKPTDENVRGEGVL